MNRDEVTGLFFNRADFQALSNDVSRLLSAHNVKLPLNPEVVQGVTKLALIEVATLLSDVSQESENGMISTDVIIRFIKRRYPHLAEEAVAVVNARAQLSRQMQFVNDAKYSQPPTQGSLPRGLPMMNPHGFNPSMMMPFMPPGASMMPAGPLGMMGPVGPMPPGMMHSVMGPAMMGMPPVHGSGPPPGWGPPQMMMMGPPRPMPGGPPPMRGGMRPGEMRYG